MAKVNWEGQLDGELGGEWQEPEQRPEADPEFRRAFSTGGGLIPNANLRSPNYVGGLQGWSLDKNGRTEFNQDISNSIKLVGYSTTDSQNIGTGVDLLKTFSIQTGANNVLDQAGEGWRVKYWGITANNANAKELFIFLGGSQVFASGALPANTAWHIDATFLITNISGTDYTVKTYVGIYGTGFVGGNFDASEVLDMSTGSTEQIQLKAEAVADGDVECRGMTVELLKYR